VLTAVDSIQVHLAAKGRDRGRYAFRRRDSLVDHCRRTLTRTLAGFLPDGTLGVVALDETDAKSRGPYRTKKNGSREVRTQLALQARAGNRVSMESLRVAWRAILVGGPVIPDAPL